MAALERRLVTAVRQIIVAAVSSLPDRWAIHRTFMGHSPSIAVVRWCPCEPLTRYSYPFTCGEDRSGLNRTVEARGSIPLSSTKVPVWLSRLARTSRRARSSHVDGTSASDRWPLRRSRERLSGRAPCSAIPHETAPNTGSGRGLGVTDPLSGRSSVRIDLSLRHQPSSDATATTPCRPSARERARTSTPNDALDLIVATPER
jgi:hypothetical protein